MATPSPEADRKKRKHSLDTKRDQRQPRVAPRYQPSQHAPIFETESILDTSNAQTPSPIKSASRPPPRVQHRKAFSVGRSLAPTYAATPRKASDTRSPTSKPLPGQSNGQPPLKPRPTQTPRSTPRSDTTPPQSRASPRLKTPSPDRGRPNLITSPSSSASSPPRGLAEAYQRIVDEELLAAEESIEEMAEYMEEDPYSPEKPPPDDDTGFGTIESNDSPTSQRASRRASIQNNDENQRPKPSFRDIYESLRDAEEDTASSMPISARSDSPIREDSQHAKDLRRMNGAVKSTPQIFRKALVGKRAGLTVENLKRNNDSSDSLASPLAGSLSSRASDPAVNVPRQWGRKARPGTDWLSRINSKSGRLTGDVPKRRILDDPVVVSTQGRDTANKLAAAAAEIPLPSGDEVSLSSQGSTPTAAVSRAKSRDRVLDWESQDQDFTGRSLQVSDSPPVRMRNATLDRILEKEIDTVARRAVTTNRLGELRERSSAERLGKRPPSRSSEPATTEEGVLRQEPENPLRRSMSEAARTPSRAIETYGHGDPIPDTPVVIYRSDSGSSRANDDSLTSEETHRSASQRPKHDRQDSHSLLRKLARATSASPSPSRDIQGGSNDADTARSTKLAEATDRTSQNQRADHDRDRSDTAKTSISNQDNGKQQTPQQPKSNAYLKTPMVTGAWIDTPLPTGGRGPPMPTPDIGDNDQKALRSDSQNIATGDLIRKLSPHMARPKMPDEELRKTAPRLPRSALESIVNAAKSKAQGGPRSLPPPGPEEDPTLLLGESTIHSLEELIVHDTDISAVLDPSPNLGTRNTHSSASGLPASSKDNVDEGDTSPPASPITSSSRPRLADPSYYTDQLSRLSRLVPSLRETRAGLASLERSLSAPSTPTASKALSQQPHPSSKALTENREKQ
ncbi:MAG: hypothetical protein Q9174_004029, partial [Haloplaca sp. 1 TL-2023]